MKKFSKDQCHAGQSNNLFTVKDCIRYYYDEFKLSKGYEIWKSNGKNEENIQQMYEATSSLTSVLDEDETMVDDDNNTSHHHICMECGVLGIVNVR